MMPKAESDILTHVGPGTPAGEMFRRYWLPVGISDEVGAVPRKVRVLGEDLVLFRNDKGVPGLLGLQCPHRLTSFEYGRVECGGIRCCYHGWLFDLSGRCLEMPGEPKNSSFKDKVKHIAYPCQEAGGLVFAYMGPGEPPLLPSFEILHSDAYARRVSIDWPVFPCNWLQIAENDIDPVHASVLHNDATFAQNTLFPRMATRIEFEETEHGVMYTAYRPGLEEGTTYVRRVNQVPPAVLAFGPGRSPDRPNDPEFGGSLRWRVPIDDTATKLFSLYAMPKVNLKKGSDGRDMGGIVAPKEDVQASLAGNFWQPERGPDGRFVLNQTWKQDYVAIVSQGAIVDRTRERLGTSDGGVISIRKMHMEAIRAVQEGRDPKGVERDAAKRKWIRFPRTNQIGRTEPEFAVTYAEY
jgi:5,5'-dehydrodivanillate O-demethylase